MNKSKLILILKSLNKKEMKEFELYINSPLFNKNRDVLNLLSILKKYYPHFEHNSFSHEVISQKLFGKINIQRLRYAMTDLTKLAEQFIAYKEYSDNSNKHLIKAYQSRGLNKFFNQETKKHHHQISKISKIRDENYYKNIHDLSELSFHYTLEHDNRNIDTQLQDVVDNLDLFYLSKKLKYSCEIINRMNILKVKYDIKLLENLLTFLNKNPFENSPSISVYQKVLLTLQNPQEEKNYTQLKQLITKHLHVFRREDQYDLYGYLQNYCIKQINSGNNKYLTELFDNYNNMIESKVVIKNNTIAQFDFKNIVTVALRVEKFNWTENFINEFQHYLPQDHQTNAVTYNLARVAFYSRQYKKCLKELLKVEFTDIYYSLDSRALLLKTYYELEDFESALSLIKAFKIYLKRDKKISAYQNATYSNFLKVSNTIVRYKLGYKKDISKIENEFNNIKQVADSTWLNQKIKSLT